MLIPAGKHYINVEEIVYIEFAKGHIKDYYYYVLFMKNGKDFRLAIEEFEDFKKKYTERYKTDVF